MTRTNKLEPPPADTRGPGPAFTAPPGLQPRPFRHSDFGYSRTDQARSILTSSFSSRPHSCTSRWVAHECASILPRPSVPRHPTCPSRASSPGPHPGRPRALAPGSTRLPQHHPGSRFQGRRGVALQRPTTTSGKGTSLATEGTASTWSQ